MPIKQLWAPWRMEFIKGDRPEGCVFCSALTSNDDRASLVLHRSPNAYAILNKYPYNNGHLMVVPNRHLAELPLLTDEEMKDMWRLAQQSIKILKEVYDPEGFNMGMNLGGAAGAGIRDHLHLHVLPRWNADTNFMPVLAETKSIPQHLDDSFTLLQPRFGRG